MGKVNFKQIANNIVKTASKHSPEILTGLGIVGMGTTVIFAVKGTVKATKIIEQEKRDRNEPISKKEVVKATWKCYIPAAVTCVTSMACIIGASSINARRNAALAAAYNISTVALSEYKDKVVETIGEKKEQTIRESIAKDKLEKNPVSSNEVVVTEKGTTLCYDGIFGRYFRSDRDAIVRAVNNINRRIVLDSYVSLNEFYGELGLNPIPIGDDLGWNFDDKQIEVEFSSQLAEDGTPCLVIEYNVAPKYGYSKFF